VLRETEWERKAARTRRVVDAAAAKLQRAKAKPQSLDGAERPKPRPGLRIVATLELRYMHRAADDQKDCVPLRHKSPQRRVFLYAPLAAPLRQYQSSAECEGDNMLLPQASRADILSGPRAIYAAPNW
jgi:hypothetical protein